MEKIAKKLARNVSLSLGHDSEKEAVIAYGLIALIQVSVTILLVLLFGFLVGAPAEAMIICLSASILRKYSGGAHARTPELCTTISVAYCTLTACLSRFLTAIYLPVSMAIALAAVFFLSFLTVYKLAPVDSPNKPIRTEKKKKRMRKGSFIILSVYAVLSIVFFFLSFRIESFRSYGIGMLFGISWQVFTLTSFGSLFIDKMNNTFSRRKEV